MNEKTHIEKSQSFQKDFENQYLQAVEQAGYLRTNLQTFPTLTRFNLEIEQHMQKFIDFLQQILQMRLNNELQGTLSILIPDHMLREECYYLTKLAQVSTAPSPQCDPVRPRINGK